MVGPGYKQWPEPLQTTTAVVALMYRELEATTRGSEIRVVEDLRPARIDYPRLISELSKRVSAMPLLEAVEQTVDDCRILLRWGRFENRSADLVTYLL